jgi:hypothetical protein
MKIQENQEIVNHEPESKEEFVAAKAYQEVQKDMFKYKTALKEKEAILSQLKLEKEQREQQALQDNEEWKTLYENTRSKLEEINKARTEEKEQFINYHKKNAVLKEIGGFKRDEYSKFINVSSVELDEEGNLVQESLLNEVNRIKQQYPELLKSSNASPLPADAPKVTDPMQKSWSEMTKQERDKLKEKLIYNK